MTTAPAWTDLRAIPAERWLTATLKGTQTDVELVVPMTTWSAVLAAVAGALSRGP